VLHEERNDVIQELHIALVLHDGELRKYLITASHVGVSIDADVEAASPSTKPVIHSASSFTGRSRT